MVLCQSLDMGIIQRNTLRRQGSPTERGTESFRRAEYTLRT